MRKVFGFWGVVLAVLLSGVLAVGVGSPAFAAVVVPAPPPVNILPSVLKGAVMTGTGAVARGQVLLAVMLKSFAVEASAQKALLAGAAGTPAQLAEVTKVKTGFKMPAVKLGGLVKGAGVVGLALMANDLVVGIGHGVTEAFGVDVEGDVCRTGSGLLATISQVDCGQWKMTADAVAAANADIDPDLVTSGWLCRASAPDVCIRLAGSRAGGVQDPTGIYYNVEMTGVSTAGGEVPLAVERFSYGIWEYGSQWIGTAGGTGAAGFCRSLWGLGAWCMNVNHDYPISGIRWINKVLDGAAEAPLVAAEADPERVLRCQLTLGNGVKLSSDTASFKESEGVTPPVLCPEFPPELEVANVTIWEVGGGQTHELYNQDTTPEYQAARTAYPECGDGTCLLDLWQVSPEVSCFQSPESCAEWFKDPNKASKFSCHYGANVVDLSECAVYAPTFKPGARETGNAYGDPVTGEPLPNSGPGSHVGTGFENPQHDRECFPSGWSVFNPVEWVMKPVQCAIEWAMVPTPGKLEAAREEIKSKFDLSPPGRIAIAISTALIGMEVPTGCSGITIPLDWMKQGAFSNAPFPSSFKMLNACEGDPLYPWAVFSSLVVSAGLVFVAFKTLPALIGKIFTYTGIDG